MKFNKSEKAAKLLQTSLKSLEKHHHLPVTSKFAQMEFQYGDSERGKTMFESILSSYPKRIDLWSVYIDMLIKYQLKDAKNNDESIEAIRNVLERAIALHLPAKKMQTVFRKYLNFEVKYGNESTVARVRQKAHEYVEGNPLLAV